MKLPVEPLGLSADFLVHEGHVDLAVHQGGHASQERQQGGEPVQPDGGAASGLDGVAYGEECHEPNHVEEQKHGAEGLGMPVVVPLAAELWDGELAGSSGRAGGARGLCGARPRCRLAGCRRICE